MRYTLIILLFFGATVNAQVLSPDRRTDWSLAGLKTDFPDYTATVYFEDEGGIGDGVFSNSAVLSTILSEHVGESFEVIFPAGDFYFDAGFSLPSNCRLAGSGADSTVLLFDLGGIETDLFSVTGTIETEETGVTAGIEFGAYTCFVDDSTRFIVGDWVLISDNDVALTTSAWAAGTSGQLLQIQAISGFELQFDSPFRRPYLLENLPYLKKVNPKKNVQIENLKLTRLDETIGQSNQIGFDYAVNCEVKCIESENCNFSHIRFQFSNNCEVSGSFFHDAHSYGDGGKGYGVVCQFATGECLIRDNNFKHLRHAMLLQSGANGNVYSYNYSQEPYWTDVALPSNSAGDIVLHGNYVYANLFEGNSCQNIVIDDSHGINGPYNTFFRNRAELYGIFMNSSPATDRQNFIGNEITNEGVFLGLYAFAGTDHFFYGNNHRGETKPAGTADLTEASLYLEMSPLYYEYYSNWPPIGYPSAASSFNNEAYDNFYAGWFIQCENTYEDLTIEEQHELGALQIFPNPSQGLIKIKTVNGEPLNEVGLYDLTGKLIYVTVCNENVLELNDLPSGIYMLRTANTAALVSIVR